MITLIMVLLVTHVHMCEAHQYARSVILRAAVNAVFYTCLGLFRVLFLCFFSRILSLKSLTHVRVGKQCGLRSILFAQEAPKHFSR